MQLLRLYTSVEMNRRLSVELILFFLPVKVTLIYVYFPGKAVGGRKAKENRLRIKHFTSGQYSSGFHGDLNVAVSKILNEKERFVDKSKEKRKVIKDQTNGTRTSMAKSIVLGKVNCSQLASSWSWLSVLYPSFVYPSSHLSFFIHLFI